MGIVENQQAQDIDDDWVRERKKEFQEVIDSDRNGIVTMEELEVSHESFLENISIVCYICSRGVCQKNQVVFFFYSFFRDFFRNLLVWYVTAMIDILKKVYFF